VVKTVTLWVVGIVAPIAGFMIVEGLLRGVGKWVVALPTPIRALIIAGGLAALANPDSRRWLIARCVDVSLALASAGQSGGCIDGDGPRGAGEGE
jgi:hypothetical protein